MKVSRGGDIENVPRGFGVLVCPICLQEIGTFNPEEVSIPVTASMFRGKFAANGIPSPFYAVIPGMPETERWQNLKCSLCSRPIFVDQQTAKHVSTILTRYGPWAPGDPLPRLPTADDERQKAINEEWEKYDPRSAEERNQEAIEEAFPEEPEEEPVNPKRPHVCPYCGKGFKHPSSLSRHVNHRCKGKP